MDKCVFCDNVTALYEYGQPICLRCLKARDQSNNMDFKATVESDEPDSGNTDLLP
jgi:hypothetical protein